MRYTKDSFPNIGNTWYTLYGYMDELEIEVYCEELNNGIID